MLEVLEKLTRRRQESRRQQAASYIELVRAIANEQAPPISEVDAMLAASGKSEMDLQRDVETMRERLRLAEGASRVVAIRVKVAEIERRHNENADKLRQKIAELESKVAETADELRSLNAEAAPFEDAERRLAATCIDPLVLEREAATMAELRRLNAKRQEAVEARRAANVAYHRAQYESVASDRNPSQQAVVEKRQAFETAQAEHDRHDERVREIDEAIKPINAELTRIHRAKLEP